MNQMFRLKFRKFQKDVFGITRLSKNCLSGNYLGTGLPQCWHAQQKLTKLLWSASFFIENHREVVCAQIKMVLDGKWNQSGIDRYNIVSIFVKPKFVCFSQCWCGKILNNESGWQKSRCLSTMYFILTFKI